MHLSLLTDSTKATSNLLAHSNQLYQEAFSQMKADILKHRQNLLNFPKPADVVRSQPLPVSFSQALPGSKAANLAFKSLGLRDSTAVDPTGSLSLGGTAQQSQYLTHPM